MKKKFTRLSEFPFYVWLLAIYPIGFLYSQNLGLVLVNEVVIVLVLSILGISFLFLYVNLFIKHIYKTAFILGVCVGFFFFSGHIYPLIFTHSQESLWLWTFAILIFMFASLVAIQKRGSYKFFTTVTPTFNLILFTLLIFPITIIMSYYLSTPSITTNIESNNVDPQIHIAKVKDSSTRPDIYYIIPDAYPNDTWMREAMDYDNSEFTQNLEDRGFIIASHAQSNYGITLVSIPSILNMKYFDTNESSPPIADLDYLRLSIANNLVAKKLKELGYTYVQFLSGYLIPSSIADITRDFTPQGPIDVEINKNELSINIVDNPSKIPRIFTDIRHFYERSFITLFINTTLLRMRRTEIREFLQGDTAPYDMTSGQRFLDTMNSVESVAVMPEATFTVIHLLKPHRPTVFNENGDIIPDIEQPTPEEHLAELRFINSEFLKMFDTILENSENPPIIIFQADHGSVHGNNEGVNRRLIHFDPYAAYYLPPEYSLELPEEYTLINTFPIILNTVFGTQYELQENRLIELLVGNYDPFNQEDVTDIFQRN